MNNLQEDAKSIFKRIKKNITEGSLYKDIENKYNYQNVRDYGSIKNMIISCLAMTGNSDNILPSMFNQKSYLDDIVWQENVLASLSIIQNQLPLYWLEKEWLKMILKTDLPSVIDEIKMPFKEAILILPENLIISPDGFPVEFIYFKHFLAGEKGKDILIDSNFTRNYVTLKNPPKLSETITWSTTMYGLGYMENLNVKAGKIIRGGFDFYNFPDTYDPKTFNQSEEKAFMVKISDLIIKTILFLQIYPQI
uniref:hypothetical protein n=1 Tax=Cyanothece sp. BG0011 TaxID=2082950 RepID=UPI000D1F013D